MAIAAPATPPQFSLPHSPVANARVTVLPPAPLRLDPSGVAVPDTLVEMTFVFQFMLMLVSLYGLKTRPAGAFPVEPPPVLPVDPLEEPLLEEPPEELPPVDPPPVDPPPVNPPVLPPGHVVPPGSHPVPQLVVAQW